MKFKLLVCLFLFVFAAVCQLRAIDADLGRFLSVKQQQIRDLSEGSTNPVPALVWKFFDAVRVDDWRTATNLSRRLEIASARYEPLTNDPAVTPALQTHIWPAISESIEAYEGFHRWDNQWLHRYGRDIIQSIPSGSIYFGGTDPGRFVISALCESQVEGKPFFTVTQNQLADDTYVDYLRAMYGKKIHIPTADEKQQAFQDYIADAQARLEHDNKFPNEPRQIKPGETVKIVDGRVQVSGQVPVMMVNGLIAKKLIDENPTREVFAEESFPLDWMYPHLEPHGPIMKLNRQPLTRISEKQVADDQAYWKKLTADLVGNWMDEKTSLKTLCEAVEKYQLRNDPADKPYQAFAKNDSARKTFSKMRCAIGGVYFWRSEQTKDQEERKRMNQAADLAFRQAYAICPFSPEAIWRYTQMLANRGRMDDAILIVKTSLHLNPDDEQLKNLLRQLMKNQ